MPSKETTTMTNEETLAIRKALKPRRTFDDYLLYGFYLIGVASTSYFGAHLLAYLVGG